MIARATVIRLIIFAIIGVLGIGYTWYQYAGGDHVIGSGFYTVKVHLAKGGGIFTNAEVTYRGVRVGKVSDTELTPQGMVVDLDIRNSAPPIPANAHAAVHDLSAVGEQYVDLTPTSASGPSFQDLPPEKRTISEQHGTTPLPPQKLINNLDALNRSVPTQSLRTVVTELGKAFAGTGSDLQKLLDTSSSFNKASEQHLPQTVQLADTSRTVLNTQIEESGAFQSFSRNLEKLSATLKSSDPDLRHVIAATPPAAQAIDRVLRESGPNLSVLLANLLTLNKVAEPRTSGLELLLTEYPLYPFASHTILPGDGTAHLGLVLNTFNPPPCVRGYQGTNRRPGDATKPQQPNYQAYCAEPHGSPIDVRGSENAPYKGVPVASSPGGSGQQSPSAPGGPSAGGAGAGPGPGGGRGVFSLTPLGPSNLAGLLSPP